MNTPATERLLNAFYNGEVLTSRQIESRYGVARGRKVVENLRLRGFLINAEAQVNTKGRRTIKFYLGTPTREFIAAAYRALGAQNLNMVRLSA